MARKMHFKNETEINTNTCNTTKTTTSCTSSTDSGIIIVDNVNANGNNNNNNNNTSYTNSVDNSNNSNNNNLNNAKDNDKNAQINAQQQQQQQQQTQYNDRNYTNDMHNNTNNNNNKNINIENIINIGNAQMSHKTSNSRPSYSPSMPKRPSCTPSPEHSPQFEHKQTTTTATSKQCSPALSIRSTTISIVSIDENAIDSSIVDSDSEREADAEGVYTVKKLGQQITYPPNSSDLPDFHKGFKVIGQQISPHGGDVIPLPEQMLNGGLALTQPASSTPQIGSIALTNSTDVTFGDKHFYEGPVTIQQFLIDSRDKWKANPDDEAQGHDNPTFTHDHGVNHTNPAPKAGANAPPQEKPFAFISNRKAIITTGIIVLLTVLIGLIILTATNILDSPLTQSKQIGDGDDSRKNIPINSTIDKDNIGGGRVLRILPRDAWLAQPPSNAPIQLKLPVQRIIVLPTQTEDCTTQAACTYRVRYIQTFNIESQRHDDIVYNFLIGGDGSVYEGRGWDNMGAHLKGFNENSISFAYIGTFRKQPPAGKQMNVTELLIAEGLRLGKLSADYRIYAASKLDPTSTATSADALYASFQNWTHWAGN